MTVWDRILVRYILDGKRAVLCPDLKTWTKSFDDRHVARSGSKGVEVSTIFLGIDHSFGSGPPLLFETMVFGGEHDGHQERCSTWEEAEAMHKRIAAWVGV